MSGKALKEIWIIGTGKMALDIGLFFWSKGYCVAWRSVNGEHLDAFGAKTAKRLRRQAKIQGDVAPLPSYRFESLTAPCASAPTIVIETTVEDVERKQEALLAVTPFCSDDTLICSNSSSILPQKFSPRIFGMHFFFPVAFTTFVEIIFQEGMPEAIRQKVKRLAEEVGLTYAVQGTQDAFAMNRILLPLQAEVVRSFHGGYALNDIDACTASGLISFGQVQLMDAIGLDVLGVSVENYLDRMGEEEANPYRPLSGFFTTLVAAGFLGKNKKRAILGATDTEIRGLFEDAREGVSPCNRPAKEDFLYLFINTCLDFLQQGQCEPHVLSEFFSSVLGAECTLVEVIQMHGQGTILKRLQDLYTSEGISYFKPCPLLSEKGALDKVV